MADPTVFQFSRYSHSDHPAKFNGSICYFLTLFCLDCSSTFCGSVRTHPNLNMRMVVDRHAKRGGWGRCGVHIVSQLTRLNDQNAPNSDTGVFAVVPVSGNLMKPAHNSGSNAPPPFIDDLFDVSDRSVMPMVVQKKHLIEPHTGDDKGARARQAFRGAGFEGTGLDDALEEQLDGFAPIG